MFDLIEIKSENYQKTGRFTYNDFVMLRTEGSLWYVPIREQPLLIFIILHSKSHAQCKLLWDGQMQEEAMPVKEHGFASPNFRARDSFD